MDELLEVVVTSIAELVLERQKGTHGIGVLPVLVRDCELLWGGAFHSELLVAFPNT